MDLQLSDKTVLVTGSTQGIGFAIASLFAEEGAKVILNGRSEDKTKAAVARLNESVPNANVSCIAADLSTAAGCKLLTDALPTVDVLINNMGIFNPVAFEEISDQEWSDFFETNVMSGVRLSRHYLPAMREKDWGRILFISSESGIQIPEEMVHYGMTKSAQIAVARGIAESVKGTNITVNSVLPGPTRSEGVDDFVGKLCEQQGMSFDEMETAFFETARPSSLIRRFADVKEVANMVVYLSSPLASATNGAAVRVDGGVVKSAF